MSILTFGSLALGLLLFAVPPQRPPADPADPTTWTATAVVAGRPVRAGDAFRVRLTLTVKEGWYVYAVSQGPGGPIPMSVSLRGLQRLELSGNVVEPEPHVARDAALKIESRTHAGRVTFGVPIRVKKDAPSGTTRLTIEVEYQACTKTLCLQPMTKVVTIPVTVASF